MLGDGSNDRGAHPVDDRPTGSLGRRVNDRSSKAVSGLYHGEIVTQQ